MDIENDAVHQLHKLFTVNWNETTNKKCKLESMNASNNCLFEGNAVTK
jgi:hypothetical protein